MSVKTTVYIPARPESEYIINFQRVRPVKAQVTGQGCVLVQIELVGSDAYEVPVGLGWNGEHRAMKIARNFYNASSLARDHGRILEAPYWQIRASSVGEGFVGYLVSFTTNRADQNAHQE